MAGYTDTLIHPSFPPPGDEHGSHEGSQSSIPSTVDHPETARLDANTPGGWWSSAPGSREGVGVIAPNISGSSKSTLRNKYK